MCSPSSPGSHMASTLLPYAGHNVLPYGPWISNGIHSAFLCRFQCASLWALYLTWHPHSFLMQVTMCSPMGPESQTASTLLSYAGPNVLPYGPCISYGIHTAFLCRSQCAPLWALDLKGIYSAILCRSQCAPLWALDFKWHPRPWQQSRGTGSTADGQVPQGAQSVLDAHMQCASLCRARSCVRACCKAVGSGFVRPDSSEFMWSKGMRGCVIGLWAVRLSGKTV